MLTIKKKKYFLDGPAGKLQIPGDDEITLKLAMIYEGECTELGPLAAARKFGFSKPRYFQLRSALEERGAAALKSQTRGPKTQYRRTQEIVRQIIRHRFLDPEASVAVIAQKLSQTQHSISIRSIERVVADYGLQKKTLRAESQDTASQHPDPTHPPQATRRTGRS